MHGRRHGTAGPRRTPAEAVRRTGRAAAQHSRRSVKAVTWFSGEHLSVYRFIVVMLF